MASRRFVKNGAWLRAGWGGVAGMTGVYLLGVVPRWCAHDRSRRPQPLSWVILNAVKDLSIAFVAEGRLRSRLRAMSTFATMRL
jgi:hypothetical protein